jgi:hypothetical protein
MLKREAANMHIQPMQKREERKIAETNRQYEIGELSHKYDLSRGEAAALIKRYGSSRSKLDAILAERYHA